MLFEHSRDPCIVAELATAGLLEGSFDVSSLLIGQSIDRSSLSLHRQQGICGVILAVPRPSTYRLQDFFEPLVELTHIDIPYLWFSHYSTIVTMMRPRGFETCPGGPGAG